MHVTVAYIPTAEAWAVQIGKTGDKFYLHNNGVATENLFQDGWERNARHEEVTLEVCSGEQTAD